MKCPHGFDETPQSGCALCWFGCPPDWTAETCSHEYSVSIEGAGGSVYRIECDACGNTTHANRRVTEEAEEAAK